MGEKFEDIVVTAAKSLEICDIDLALHPGVGHLLPGPRHIVGGGLLNTDAVLGFHLAIFAKVRERPKLCANPLSSTVAAGFVGRFYVVKDICFFNAPKGARS